MIYINYVCICRYLNIIEFLFESFEDNKSSTIADVTLFLTSRQKMAPSAFVELVGSGLQLMKFMWWLVYFR